MTLNGLIALVAVRSKAAVWLLIHCLLLLQMVVTKIRNGTRNRMEHGMEWNKEWN